MSNLDNLTRAGADELAQKLDRYWHSRGAKHVRHEVIKIDDQRGQGVFAIRSNLINGMPPVWTGVKNGTNS